MLKDEPTYYTDLWKTGQMLKFLHEAYMSNPTAIIKLALKLMGRIGSSVVAEDTPAITPDQESRIYNLLVEYELI